ncbi:MAG: hypothetical protein IPM32_02255 [Ignavibacteriae bacterium]|nr:hypothetical protein [Ignavibacteriota bacterium]
MYQILKIKLIVLTTILFVNCENPLEDKLNKLEDELESQKIEQENQKELIKTLLFQLTRQQEIIDSLNLSQKQYSDSLNSELERLIENQAQTIQMLIASQPETNENYLRIDSLQMCWGNGRTNMNGVTLEFPVSFIDPPKILMDLIVRQNALGVDNITNSSARFYMNWEGYCDFSYFAIGKWK